MEEGNDMDDWLRHAMENDELVAQELIYLIRPEERIPWRQLLRSVPLPEEDPPRRPAKLSAWWGVRKPRGSRKKSLPPMPVSKADPAAESPTNPFSWSGGSGASVSGGGGDDGSSAVGHDGGDGGVVKGVASDSMVMRFNLTDPQTIRRSGKKKTIPELRVLEQSVLEDRKTLQREMGAKRRAHEALVEQNQKLKRLQLTLKAQMLPVAQTCDAFDIVPDLNLPLLEDSC